MGCLRYKKYKIVDIRGGFLVCLIFGHFRSFDLVIWLKIFGCPVVIYSAVWFWPNGPTFSFPHCTINVQGGFTHCTPIKCNRNWFK